MTKIRILLVDDHVLFREGLVGIIAMQPDFEVVGEANDGVEAVVMARELKPDLILMDIEMPVSNGLEATRQIKRDMPATIIVMLTVQADEQRLFQAIQAGAQGYLLKNMRAKEILTLLRGAIQGQVVLSPNLARYVLEEFRRLSQNQVVDIPLEPLSHREHEVLGLVAMGQSDKEIAETLSLSLHTVKSHLRNILAKLHVNNRHEAAYYAKKQGWLT